MLQHTFIDLLCLKTVTTYQIFYNFFEINQALFGKKVEINNNLYKDNFLKFSEDKSCLYAKNRGKSTKACFNSTRTHL